MALGSNGDSGDVAAQHHETEHHACSETHHVFCLSSFSGSTNFSKQFASVTVSDFSSFSMRFTLSCTAKVTCSWCAKKSRNGPVQHSITPASASPLAGSANS